MFMFLCHTHMYKTIETIEILNAFLNNFLLITLNYIFIQHWTESLKFKKCYKSNILLKIYENKT